MIKAHPILRVNPRAAFTLFEVLVALALSTLLLAAAYASFDLYYRLRTAGEEEVEQAQIARALLQRMQDDLLAVIYQPPSGDSASAMGTIGQVDTDSTSTATSTTDAAAGGNRGLVGDGISMVIDVNLPRSHAGYAPVSAGPIGLPTSDLKSVTYLLAGQGMNPLSQAVADRFASADDGSGIVGLARIEGDRLLMLQADEVSDVETIAAQAQLLASEIKSMQFEYTDGLAWYDAWDTAVYGSLPRAVRMSISFQDSETIGAVNGPETPKVYQLTVVLPPSDPIGGESTDTLSEEDSSGF